jgi:rhamnogalacturonyl hydrolase YesR
VLFGDWQTCFQTYIDLYRIEPEEIKIERAKEVMYYQMSTENRDYWWWSDGLYMAMPVMTKLYKLTGDELFLEKMQEYYQFAEELMYDEEYALFFRDAKYVYPKEPTINGKKNFWSRGNGWVFAAYAKVMQDLPEDNAFRKIIEQRFIAMAASLKKIQQPEGYWTRSLLDPEHAPGPETSGTAFFTYAYFWGINNGLLDKKEYLPTAAKAWSYLSKTALQEDFSIGYVQPIGERAIPGQTVDARSTANFGVGAFLLAACELARYLD